MFINGGAISGRDDDSGCKQITLTGSVQFNSALNLYDCRRRH